MNSLCHDRIITDYIDSKINVLECVRGLRKAGMSIYEIGNLDIGDKSLFVRAVEYIDYCNRVAFLSELSSKDRAVAVKQLDSKRFIEEGSAAYINAMYNADTLTIVYPYVNGERLGKYCALYASFLLEKGIRRESMYAIY